MKNLLISLIVLNSLNILAQDKAGVDGGGGKGVVCRDDNNQIISAELLDLYEGRVQYGISVPLSDEPVMDQVRNAIGYISEGKGENFKESLNFTAKLVNLKKRILPNGTGLEDIDDSHHVITTKDCAIEQLANFTKGNQVLIDGEIWNKLNNTNKAALIVHEALYKQLRNYGATNSIRARKFVTLGFIELSSWDIKGSLPEDNKLECFTIDNGQDRAFPWTKFWAYNDEEGELIFQFDYLDGGLMLSKSTIQIDQISIEDIDNNTDSEHMGSTYWVSLNSIYEEGIDIAISFQTIAVRGETRVIKKISIGSMPSMPTREFTCF